MTQVSVDIVSDVVCPWCWLGLRYWDQARELVPEIQTETLYRPFQLDGAIPPGGVAYKDYMKKKFGDGPDDRFKMMREHLEQAGPAAGINFRFSGIPMRPNTLNAHRVIRWAQGQDLGEAASERLHKAFFDDHLDIGDPAILSQLAGEIGLDADIVASLLQSDQDSQAVLDEEQFYRRLGVQGVPCFIFNGQFAVSGAEAPEVLADAIRQAASLPQDNDDAG
ncbi:MAG: frnE protein [Oceanicaulis sp.]|uniref:DsbA family oxidoreductase n=1 Tax=Oceanicaulis sp. UBA2681 TaxID=1947007 RepID=UPI000C09E205|nr:DsbA family oxidoreductase [Oceanicaulis sp. UBA2681]MAP49426.1 frnE protein [Oceanicaulis sp.]|tara:strand:- start:1494 stop:2159 length:666 start_codon:yes stop_codon:yes gene_type:complete